LFVCGDGEEDTVTDYNEAEGDIAAPDCENINPYRIFFRSFIFSSSPSLLSLTLCLCGRLDTIQPLTFQSPLSPTFLYLQSALLLTPFVFALLPKDISTCLDLLEYFGEFLFLILNVSS
jgi:hypothetical protein